jgi:DNA-binding transcriptional MerR regulator
VNSRFYDSGVDTIDEAATLGIGDVAKATGLSEDTLRYYERIGLTPHIERAPSGHRRYRNGDLAWFTFVTHMRATGMSLETLGRYAELVRAGAATAAARRELLTAQAALINDRIADLHAALAVIEHKLERLDAGTSTGSDGPRC